LRTRDVFGYSFSAIKLRKLRAALTTLGIVIGIAAIIALLSLTQGESATITQSFEQGLSANTLVVTGQNTPLYANYTDQIMAIPSVSQDITATIPVIQQAGYLTNSSGSTLKVTLIGINFTAAEQAFPTTFASASGTIPLNPPSNAIIVGAKIGNLNSNGTIFVNVGDQLKVTTQVPIANETYMGNVTAVFAPIGGVNFAGPSDIGVYIPINQAQAYFGTNQLSEIIVQLKSSSNGTVTTVSKAISNYFSGQVNIESATSIINTVTSALSTVSAVAAGIAGISLLVAGVSIMNIMIVSMVERTREIGILKALGMKSRTVRSAFLCESAIVGLIGTLVGIGVGWGLANLYAALVNHRSQLVQVNGASINLSPVLTPEVVILALAFGIGVSILFAMWPAWRASKLKVVEALRYE
jgi:putative ABC transport system permease protein